VPTQPSQPSQPSPQEPVSEPEPTLPSPEQQQPQPDPSGPDDSQSPPDPSDSSSDDEDRQPEPDDSGQRRTRTVNETTQQDQEKSGSVDLPDDSVPRIGDFPPNGIATVDEDGNWVYTPRPGFSGEDRFTIMIRNADGSEEEVTLIINVEEPGLQPEGDGQDSNTPISTPRTAGVALASLYSLWLILAASFALRHGFGLQNKMASKLHT